MKTIHTASCELFSRKGPGVFYTEPYEAGWADEAIVFVSIHELDQGACLILIPQISVDGVRWIDHKSVMIELNTIQNDYLTLNIFGNWLRIKGIVKNGSENSDDTVILDIYWVFKG